MDFNDVERYLREGGDAQTIAQAFADKLNEALRIVNDENEIKEAADNVVFAWEDFVDTYFSVHDLPKGFTVSDFYMNNKELMKLIETFVQIAPYFEKYVSTLEKISEGSERIKNNLQSNDSFNEVINKFFNKMNI